MGDTWTEAAIFAYAYDSEQATHTRIPPALVERRPR